MDNNVKMIDFNSFFFFDYNVFLNYSPIHVYDGRKRPQIAVHIAMRFGWLRL